MIVQPVYTARGEPDARHAIAEDALILAELGKTLPVLQIVRESGGAGSGEDGSIAFSVMGGNELQGFKFSHTYIAFLS